MSKMLSTIQSLFPMSKGAFLAVSFMSLAGGAGYVQMQSNMERMIHLQEQTREDIHSIDVRLSVVESRIDNSLIFKSTPASDVTEVLDEPEGLAAVSDSMYSSPYIVDF